jgi:hypothetical protein
MNEYGSNAVANRLRTEVFLPALQEAARKASQIDSMPANLLNASVLAFGDMLVQIIGQDAAVHLLRGFADHLEAVKRT